MSKLVKMLLFGSILLLVGCSKNKEELDTEKYDFKSIQTVNIDRVSEDLYLLFEIHDNSSYKLAKDNIKYNCEYLKEVFEYDNYTEIYTEKPNVGVSDIFVDYNSITETNITYSASISILEYDKNKEFYVLVSYMGDIITEIKIIEIV